MLFRSRYALSIIIGSAPFRQSEYFMSGEAQRHELNYDLIKRAVHGDAAALDEILLYYDAYINSLVTYETTGRNGEIFQHIDEDMKVQVQMKLVDAIQKKWRELI